MEALAKKKTEALREYCAIRIEFILRTCRGRCTQAALLVHSFHNHIFSFVDLTRRRCLCTTTMTLLSELHSEIHPSAIVAQFLSTSAATTEPPQTLVVLLRNLQRHRGDQNDTAATCGITEVGIGDVVFVLAGRKLYRQRHLYRFAWLDAGASAAWVEEQLGPLLAAQVEKDLERASFVVAVVCGKRAALYVAPPPIVPGGDLRNNTQVPSSAKCILAFTVMQFSSHAYMCG